MEYRLPFQSSKKSKKKVGLEYFPGKKCNKCAAKEDILGLNIYVKKEATACDTMEAEGVVGHT